MGLDSWRQIRRGLGGIVVGEGETLEDEGEIDEEYVWDWNWWEVYVLKKGDCGVKVVGLDVHLF